MCFAQEHNAVTPVRRQPAAPRSRGKHSTAEKLLDELLVYSINPTDEKLLTIEGKSVVSKEITNMFPIT